jgi:hypothetical protein
MRKKFILLNGPPRSGKSTVADLILSEYAENATHYKMTSPMDEAFKSFFAISDKDWNYYREVNKDMPQERFGGHTTRQALISFSENFAKPLAGPSVFGKIALLHIPKINEEIIVTSDTGFAHEIEPLVKEYGIENFLLIRLHREGYDYGNDSRSYVTLQNGVQEVDLENINIDDLKMDVLGTVREFLGLI